MSMWTEEETPDEADELPLWNGENKMVDDEPIISDQLDQRQCGELHSLLDSYSNVMSSTPGKTTLTQHAIETGGA